MAEFKGTKGKWEVKKVANQNWVWANVRGGECLAKFSDIEENKANAQLISKAPEMLEMLNKINYFIQENKSNNYMIELLNREVPNLEQLIKEATEL